MKKVFILALAVLLTAGIASIALAGITDPASPHNLTAEITGLTEPCRICHTPHAAVAPADGPLWNHELSVAAYTMYSSDSLDGAIAGSPTGVSKLCLGCHDGTVAIDSYEGVTGAIAITDAPFNANPGLTIDPDLSDTHPISIEYRPGVDPELEDPTTATIGTGTAILPIEKYMEDTDADSVGDTLHCSTCHDVHDTEAVTGTALLRTTNSGSALCVECHIK